MMNDEIESSVAIDVRKPQGTSRRARPNFGSAIEPPGPIPQEHTNALTRVEPFQYNQIGIAVAVQVRSALDDRNGVAAVARRRQVSARAIREEHGEPAFKRADGDVRRAVLVQVGNDR